MARIDLGPFRQAGLTERHEDIEPNLDYELEQYAGRTGRKVTMNQEAPTPISRLCTSGRAIWKANFRDLGGAVTRMTTLAPGGRIDVDIVTGEIERLQTTWSTSTMTDADRILSENLSPEELVTLNRFDHVQLAEVLHICRESKSLSAAGRELFNQSRLQKNLPPTPIDSANT